MKDIKLDYYPTFDKIEDDNIDFAENDEEEDKPMTIEQWKYNAQVKRN